jgi:hypothetical protein
MDRVGQGQRGRDEGGGIVVTVVLAVAIALLGSGGIAGVVVVGGRSDHPKAWDPRVTELVAFVERERGLTFEHPVRIDFLGEDAFRKLMTESETPEEVDEAEVSSTEALLRAVGFMSGVVDVAAAGEELAGDGVVGAYIPEEERVFVRGETLDDSRRATLVHELTHVLQDQQFGIGTYRSENGRTSGEIAAYTAAVEADAEDVEEAWIATLSEAARERLDSPERGTSDSTDFKGVPEVFVELLAFPYVFGPPFLHAVEAKDGEAGRNRLFVEPPKSEEHILLPQTYLDRQPVQKVGAPGLRPGELALSVGEGDVGMLSLLVMLAERVDFGAAWPAVQGWAGDAYVAFDRAGTTCVRADVQFDTAPQAKRFSDTFTSWAKDRPAHAIHNERSVLFESCDPGSAAPGRAEGHVSGIQGLALREAVIKGTEAGGIPPKAAVCITDGLLERMTADRIATSFRDGVQVDRALTGEIQRTVTQLVPGCR